MLAVLCPGQGAQTPQMLAPWLELPAVSQHLEEFSEAADTDLRRLGTTAGAEEIRSTDNAQPLIVAASLLTFEALGSEVTASVGLAAGHSVGEIAAMAVAGVLSPAEAMRLVATRGRAMAHAAAKADSGMSAVVGGKPDDVTAALVANELTPANVNGGGQVVAAGSSANLKALAAEPPPRSRVIPLQVAGAFHTSYMAPAEDAIAATAEELQPTDPAVVLLSNADGAQVGSGQQMLSRVVAQVLSPVRWDSCCATMLELGVTGAIELAPGGVLTGLARRTLPGVETIAIKTPDDLAAAQQLAARHGAMQ